MFYYIPINVLLKIQAVPSSGIQTSRSHFPYHNLNAVCKPRSYTYVKHIKRSVFLFKLVDTVNVKNAKTLNCINF